MTEQTQRSASPSQDSFVLSRRNVIKGAAAFGGIAALGGVLATRVGDESDKNSEAIATGIVRVGSNYSDAVPNAALRAALSVLPNEDLIVEINEVDHDSFNEQIVTYLQDPPDDVAPWVAGLGLQALASQGLLLDISDVWTEKLDNVLSQGFKQASTYDGKQYFVPWTYYSWQVFYRKSVWRDLGVIPPTSFEELLTLCENLDSAGVTPFALGNVGQWPAMGTFDQLNFRLNGYQYHVDLLAGKEDWTDQRTKDVFAKWSQLLPYHQAEPNDREWQDAAAALVSGEAAMSVMAGFVASQFPQNEVDDLDFFPYPELNPEHGQDTVEAPVDGWVVVANPANEAAAKEVVAHFGTALAQDAYLAGYPSVQASNSNVDTSKYNALQAKSAAAVQNAANVTQFLDRDTLPAFADEVGQALAAFLSSPSEIDAILEDLQRKATDML